MASSPACSGPMTTKPDEQRRPCHCQMHHCPSYQRCLFCSLCCLLGITCARKERARKVQEMAGGALPPLGNVVRRGARMKFPRLFCTTLIQTHLPPCLFAVDVLLLASLSHPSAFCSPLPSLPPLAAFFRLCFHSTTPHEHTILLFPLFLLFLLPLLI